MNINYKSDFVLIVQFDDGIPTYPWRMNFTTKNERSSTKSGSYTATFDGVNYFRAHPLDGGTNEVVIEFINHGLPPGTLSGEWAATFESDLFESGEQYIVTPQHMDVELIEGAGDDTIESEAWAIVSPLYVANTITVSGLTNDAVAIDNNGIELKASPNSTNNVVGGLIAVVTINLDGLVERTWLHPSVGEGCSLHATYLTYLRIMTITLLGHSGDGFGEEPDGYFCTITPYQRTVDTDDVISSANILCKRQNDSISVKIGDEGEFSGAEIFVYSNAQFWSRDEE